MQVKLHKLVAIYSALDPCSTSSQPYIHFQSVLAPNK